MDRQTYLDALRQHLQALPSHEVDEAINYFTEMFDEVGPEGEEALMASLGQPEEAAKDVLDKLLDDQPKEETQAEQKHSNATREDWTHQDFWKNFVKEQIRFAKEQVRQAVEQAKETGQIKVYFSKGNWRQQTENLAAFRKVDISLKSLDISIRPSLDGQNRLTYSVDEESPVIPVVFSQADGELTIAETDGLKSFGKGLTLECSEMDSLSLKTGSGDCDLSGLVFNHLQVTLGSGDLSLDQCQVKEGQLVLSSGDVSLESSQLAETRLSSSSGDISLSHCQLGKSTLSATSGDLQVEGCQLSGSALATTSGDLDIRASQLSQIPLTTTSGDLFVKACQLTDVKGESQSGDHLIDLTEEDSSIFKSSKVIGKLQLKTNSGDIEVKGVAQEELSLNLSSQSGDIVLFEREVTSPYQLEQVSATAHLELISHSGDILVKA